MSKLFPARAGAAAIVLAGAAMLAACTPTIRLQVEPITIYAKLDHNVRISLDEDVKTLVKQNPDLF
ncbi:YnbE family lipoprotein [Asticcacaulis sp. BYS171W]|uniref:YnbE family lipoprotein n=1 Tax=Asticcacaulis aquaticus TaxID=2984212 RepID=A0ABT5HY32_9CAUL|nr:YnbE family lipoprotein [Asticcacaulis aquaticus]MDC7684755.1 YnbE family lipoprotein [Asticcacaulis aquaticus]